ncbi:HTH-type transcriptional regulator BenM [Paraburkholderia ultramafica]|nr:HTH-type transcriptional regulator BenM [Paraburkholderia ultramafica]
MQIRSLEEELGGALFQRTSRRVVLTEAGSILLADARRLLAQADRVRSDVQRSLKGEIGSVRIGFVGSAAYGGELIEDLRRFRQLYPEVEVHLDEVAPQQLAEALLNGELDVTYSPSVLLADDSRFRAERVGRWSLAVAVADDHPLASKRRVSARDLQAEQILLPVTEKDGEGSVALVRTILGDDVRIIESASSTNALFAMVAAGLGIAVIPAVLSKMAMPGLSIQPLSGVSNFTDLVRFSRADETSGAVRAYMDCARSLKGAPAFKPRTTSDH